MIYAGLIFVLFLMFLRVLKNQERAYTGEISNILRKLREKEEYTGIIDSVQEEYDQTLQAIQKQGEELENSLEELKEYRVELDITYNSLIKKSTQLEYSNEILERRVANLSNLNAVARTVLSIIKLEKIIDIILDGIFCSHRSQENISLSLGRWHAGK